MGATHRQAARPRVVIWPDGTAYSRVDLSPIVAGFTTSKSLATPMGQWQVQLLPSLARGTRRYETYSEFAAQIRPNAVVSIGWDWPGGIMLGLVSNVNHGRSVGRGIANTITLSGNDFGKVLVNDHIIRASLTTQDNEKFIQAITRVAPTNAMIRALPAPWGPTREDGGNAFVQARVKDVAEWLLRETPAMTIPVLGGTGGSGRVGDYIRAVVPSAWNDGRIQAENLWTYQGTIWGFLDQILDRDFYDVYIDSRPRRIIPRRARVETYTEAEAAAKAPGTVSEEEFYPTDDSRPLDLPDLVLNIRPKPFDEVTLEYLPTTEATTLTWDALKTSTGAEHHQIPLDRVLNEQMGISDADVFTYYLVQSDYDIAGNPNAAAEGLFFPAVDLYGLQRHGVRAYEARLSLLGSDVRGKETGDADYVQQITSEVIEFRNRLFNWHRLADYFESGQLTVAGADDYRIGDPVYLPWKRPLRGGIDFSSTLRGLRYYCVATQHQWTLGSPYTTTLSLTRGHNQSLINTASNEIERAARDVGDPNGMKIAVGMSP